MISSTLKNFVRIFFLVFLVSIDATHSQVFVSAAGRVKASPPAFSNNFFLCVLGGNRKVWSCAFGSSILLLLLAICALRHGFVLRTGLKCSALFLVLILFHSLFPSLFLPLFDFQTTELYFLCSTRFLCFFLSPIAL